MVVTYTFDAGPNACLFLTEKYLGLVAALLTHYFSPGTGAEDFQRGEEVEAAEEEVVAKVQGSLSLARNPGGLKYLLHTSPGEGPQVVQVRTVWRCLGNSLRERSRPCWTRTECRRVDSEEDVGEDVLLWPTSLGGIDLITSLSITLLLPLT